jgi:RND family efflux transporter MFP subunit
LAAVLLCRCAAHAPPPSGPPPVSVATGVVTRGGISTYVTFDGQVSPLYQTTLSTAEAGTVASVNVTEGQFVRAGQLLASLDTSQLQAQLRANAAAVREDQAQLVHSDVAAPVNSQQYSSAVSLAKFNLQTAVNDVRTSRSSLVSAQLTEQGDRQLMAQGYVSETTYKQAAAAYVLSRETLRTNLQDLPAAQAAVQTALSNTNQRAEDQATIAQNQAGLDAARANVELLQAQIAQSSIVAPFDGQVTQRLLDPGAYAGANTAILEISQVSTVYVVANVPDVDLPFVGLGKAMTFTTPSLPQRTFHGRVFDVNTTPTSGTLSYRVRLLQPNADLALRGGMLVEVTAVRAHSEHVLLVPNAAVVAGTGGSSVFTIVAGKAKRIPVRVGLQSDALAEVHGAGLAAGSKVITSQPEGLQDGATVVTPATARVAAK